MTIIELCRELPDSEPELRARADEFNRAVQAAVMPAIVTRNFMDSIADAKAATDALRRRCIFQITIVVDGSACCQAQVYDSEWTGIIAEVCASASTEPLVRSACALLAADALSAK